MRAWAAALAVAISGLAQAQLTVSPQSNLMELARTITGPGVTISNPQINCHPQAYGQFQYSGSLLGIEEGIVLTTGKINNAVGPNNVENKSFEQNNPGNSILNKVTGRKTYDACLFEFDVIPAGDSLRFDFVFGSEEYNEWVGSQFNDVFGFFISGPGITGDPGIGDDKNIALIPGTEQAVAINNVNNGSNAAFYYDNAGGQHIQYDGFTTGLSAFSQVQPCETYHLKLVVADASDKIYDSGVFIAKVKSNPVTMELITANGGDTLVEGCNNGLVRFTRQAVDGQPLALEYYLHGTATNGTDYTAIGNVDPTVPKTITIPAGEASVDQAINLIADGTDEGMETMLFILGNPYCPGASADTLLVPITDLLHVSVHPQVSQICKGDNVQLTATGGSVFSWSPATGLSNPDSSSPTAQPLTTTTYTATISAGDCQGTVQTEVQVSDIQASASITKPLCNGASNGAINLSVQGGIPPYSYAWEGPNGFSASTEDITYIAAGTYTVTITDGACSKVFSFNVGQSAPLSVALQPSMLVFGQNISCHGGHDGAIDAVVTGGTGPYTALWAGPNGFTSSQLDLTGLGAGTYNVTITDANGCTTTASATLLASGPLMAEITSVQDVLCVGDGQGAATVSITGGMPVYSYAWNTVPAQTTATASNLAPGSYSVTATDQYGCEVQTSVTIGGPTQGLGVQLAGKGDVTCHGAANGSAAISVAGGTPDYDVVWNTTPPQNGMTATNLPGGTYTATVTDQNGCVSTKQVTILEPAAAVAINITAQQNILCHGQPTGSATASASGGTGPYSYAWNTVPVHYGASITGLSAGTWTVTATDIHGCTAVQDVIITGPAAALSATVGSVSPVSCAGGLDGSATVQAAGGTAPYSYAWNTTPNQHTATASGLGAGTWQVQITDANGCSATASATITEPLPLAASGTVTPAQCQGAANGAVDLSTTGGTAPYTWAWTGPNGFSAATEDLQSLAAGGYSVTVTDANGCSITRSFDVNQPGLFQVEAVTSVFGSAQVSCTGSNDGTIDLSVNGAVPPYQFAWTGPNGFSSQQEDLAGLTAGTYQVTITDANGCSTDREITLQAPQPIAIALEAGTYGSLNIACHGGSNGSVAASISGGNGPYTFSWTGPNGFTSTDQDLAGLMAGTYQLEVSDAYGCGTSQGITLIEPEPLTATMGGSTPASCFGSNTGQATVLASGGREPYNFTWGTTPPQYGPTASGLAPGSYPVEVADANGCTTSTTVTVGGPTEALTLALASLTPVACHNGQTGSATVQATGGTAPYTYAWNTSPVQSAATAQGLAAGTWVAEVTDAMGCTASLNVVITQPLQPLSATVAQTHPASCFGDADGTASLNVSGGSGHYAITWNTTPAQSGATATGLAAGLYTATITDANGCTQALELPVPIGGPMEPLTISFERSAYPGGAHVSCPGASDGSIDVTPGGGTPGYQYFWQDGLGGHFSTEDLSGLAAGTYHLEVIDGHGCATDTVITLVPPTPLSAAATVEPAVCHGESSGAINLSTQGGAGPYGYSWTGPNGFTAATQDLSGVSAGVYTVTITDINGCIHQQPFDVSEPGTFTFQATVDGVACNSGADGSIQVVAGGGTTPYQFEWTGPNGFTANGSSINGLSSGTYHLILTDHNGCSALHSTTLAAPPILTAFAVSVKNHGGYDVSCQGAADGQILAWADGGTAPYNFAWTGPNGFTANSQDIDYLEVGTYHLTVTDAHGCTVTSSVTLVAPSPLAATATAVSYAGGSGFSCNGESDGAITLVPSGGTQPYAVSWSGPGAFSSNAWQITGLQAGSYIATVTDGNGCSTAATMVLTAPAPLQLNPTVDDIACHGASTGSISLDVSGGSGNPTFQWTGTGAFTATTPDISDLQAGSYNVLVTDANGCTATATATVAQAQPIQASAQLTTTTCQGSNSGAIDLSVTGGTGAYDFFWTGFPAFSATTEDIDNLFAGVYTVTITDGAGCTFTSSYNVGEPDLFHITAQLSNMAGGFNVSCAGAQDGAITATVTGGTAPYTYYWTGPDGFTSISMNPDGLAAGTYALTVHDANGCNAGAHFTLVAPQALVAGMAATAQPGCSDSADGSIALAISGGVAPYSIAWTGPHGNLGTAQNLTGVGPGTYQATVTDALGCTAQASIQLQGPAAIEALAVAAMLPNGSNLSCADAGDGSITLDINGGTAPFQVLWTGPGGFQSNDLNLTGLDAGTYTAQVSDAHGCNTTAQVELLAPEPLLASISASSYSGGHGISCAGAADGTLMLAVSGGTPAYQIHWSGPGGFTAQQAALQDLAPGSYVATVIDGAGCTAYASAELQGPPPITATAVLSDHNGFEVGCNGDDGAIELTLAGGLAPYQYGWTGPNGFASTDPDLDGLAAGTYTVDVLDANGCSITRSFTLTAPEALTLTLDVTSNECDLSANGEIDLTINGGVGPFVISWDGPDGFTSTDEDLQGLASGDYFVAVTSAMGCSVTGRATLLAASPITLIPAASQYGNYNIACHGGQTGTIEVQTTGGFQPLGHAWTGPGGFTANTPNINGLAAGSYSLTVTDDHGCTRDTTITLVEPASPLNVMAVATGILCHGGQTGSIHTTANGGDGPYTFDWRGPDHTAYSTPDISNLAAGTYELVVIDANQCISTLQVDVEQPAAPLELVYEVPEHNGYNTSCSDVADGAIHLAATGGTPGYTYSWAGPGGFTSSLDSLTDLSPGVYVATVSDANGCSTQAVFNLSAPPTLIAGLGAVILPSGTAISCFGADDGALIGTVQGGSGQLTWTLTGPGGEQYPTLQPDSLAPGTYCLSVSDENGCEATQCVTLNQPEALTASATATDAPCGMENGTVDAVIGGGTQPYTYSWTNGAHSEDLNGLAPGTYGLLVTDANGCSAQATATVEGTPGVEATAEVEMPLCHDSDEGSIALTVTSGTGPFLFQWSTGATGDGIQGLGGGTYTVTITDQNGCTWQEAIEVQAPDALVADTLIFHYANGHAVSTWGGHDGSVDLDVHGGTAPYAYAWDDGAWTSGRQGLPAGTYGVTVTDANGCSVQLTILLTQPDDLALPTGFTPNGDGHNDVFIIRGIDSWPNNQLTVFNRWGNVVFDQLNYRNDWRGDNQQGQALPDGTYFVVLRLGTETVIQNYVDLRR